jgi:hypothetical protein
MLHVMVIAARQITSRQVVPEVDLRHVGWVQAYREAVPAADRWAQRLRRVHHSIETQERVFRMAEQLQRHGTPRAQLFLELEEADRSVALWQYPEAAARAGYRAISAVIPLAKESILITRDVEQPEWRRFGFEPIGFDGHDPAAYAWVMFELTLRAGDRVAQQTARCRCHPVSAPTAIGVART